ncbi:uncharacterized protein LOC116286375 isoform X2 [Actinia tenebrosa]|uniref:Uncharacterized protein LOC116286375 isoform X2 n=1 Tax=Actinia tenebrosa TaxID=6105 RepID=A0A6P8GYZ6_ACTTE|nr:uncharacterized protein LOC116286375 isoform X2 [Actinia tenebrosa]
MSNNSATTEAPFYDMGLGMPLWVVIVWAAVGVLVIAMIILIVYACHARKTAPPNDSSEDDERRMSVATFDNYPQGYINDLHTKRLITEQLFPSTFVNNMRIPRAVEVRMTDTPRSSGDFIPQQNVTEPPRVSFEELGFHGYEYEHYDDDDDVNELHPNKRISLSRDASFKASNISEENKAKQLHRERMLVNELREKIRRDKRINEEDSKW